VSVLPPSGNAFDGVTTQLTGDWFLSLLRAAGPPGDGFRDLILRGDARLSDVLSKELTTYLFIDYVRKNLRRPADVITLERIAERLETGNRWEDLPHTAILLLSLTRRDIPKESLIYQVVRRLYDRIVSSESQSDDDIEIALKAGLQLSRLETKSSDFLPFVQFEFKHLETLTKIRNKYLGTDDSATIFSRNVDRWLSLQDHDRRELLAKTDLEKFGVLHPLLLDLPIPYGSAASLILTEAFSRALQEKEKESRGEKIEELNQTLLANRLRIVQWEVLTRDVLSERGGGSLAYSPATREMEISGFPPDDFLTQFTEASAGFQYQYWPSLVGTPRKRTHEQSESLEMETAAMKEHVAAFRRLLPRIKEFHPSAYDDVIEDFKARHKGKAAFNAILVEDGEFTFFSVLWLLRHVVSLGEDPRLWLENSELELTSGFLPSFEDGGSHWRALKLADFAIKCGLLIRSTNGRYLPTRRWRSLLSWLERLCQSVSTEQNNLDSGGLLPVKMIEFSTTERPFIAALTTLFSSSPLMNYLETVKAYTDEITIEHFAEKLFGPFILCLSCDHTEPLAAGGSTTDIHPGSLLRICSPGSDQPDGSALDRDTVLIKACRSAFFPLEYLFRAYQPHELHVLTLALSFIKGGAGGQLPAPVSLGFATIVGSIPPGVLRGLKTKESHDEADKTNEAARWLAPYWTLFNSFSSELSLGAVQSAAKEAGEQGGIEEMLRSFSHEVGKIGAYLLGNYFIGVSDAFVLDGEDSVPKGRWEPAAGLLKPAEIVLDRVTNWQLCPVPSSLEHLKVLFTIWAGSKTLLRDLGVHPDWNMAELIQYLIPIARRAAASRDRIEEDVPLESLEALLLIEREGDVSLTHVAEIVFDSPDFARQIRFLGTTNKDAENCESFFIRALLAMLSNAVYHSPPDKNVCISINAGVDSVISIEVLNKLHPYASVSEKGEIDSHFWAGTKAVGQTCMKPLSGEFEMVPIKDKGEFLGTIRVPARVGEIEWMTIS
jgi:hypothetical protein